MNRRTYIGVNNPKWRGGRIDRGGYVYIHAPHHPNRTKAGYVCEHRLVVEDKLGRYLTKGEVVHHLNGIKNDNRSENLMVVTKAEHTHIHKDGVKHTPEHVQKRFANRKKADMSKFKRNALGKFTGTI